MTAGEARDWIELITGILAGRGFALLFIVAVFLWIVEKSSFIKLKPWTAIFRSFGKAINGEIIERLDQLEKKVKEQGEMEGERSAKQARIRILRFNSELIRRKRHTHEEFKNAVNDVDEYEKYCNAHPQFKNNEADLSISNIRIQYQKCMDQGDFLPEVQAE